MNKNIFTALLITFIIGFTLNGCIEPRYIERNNNHRRNHRDNRRDNRRNNHRNNYTNQLSYTPFDYILQEQINAGVS